MTVQEAIKWLKHPRHSANEVSERLEALQIAIESMEELEQYRALGTVEELKEAREKQIPKKPIHKIKRPNSLYGVCSVCGRRLVTDKYCPRCGQRILWKEGAE